MQRLSLENCSNRTFIEKTHLKTGIRFIDRINFENTKRKNKNQYYLIEEGE